jgi:hypothetical protein
LAAPVGAIVVNAANCRVAARRDRGRTSSAVGAEAVHAALRYAAIVQSAAIALEAAAPVAERVG